MEYGEVLTRSFWIMWRHRYVWVLAVLGGADVSMGGGGSYNSSGFGGSPTGTAGPTGPPGAAPGQLGRLLADNLGLLLSVVLIALLLAVAWFLLSCITTGGLIRASAEHDAERPFGFGAAWRAGLGTFWSILGLRLLAFAVALLALVVVGLLVLVGYLALAGGAAPVPVAIVVVMGVQVLGAVIAAAVLLGVVLILATRSAVLEQRGPIAAFGRGVHLLWTRPGRTLLTWLIQVALGIAAAIVVAIPLVVAVGVVAVLVLVTARQAGVGAAVLIGLPLGLVILAALLVLGGMSGSFFSTFWTVAFRRLEVDRPARA